MNAAFDPFMWQTAVSGLSLIVSVHTRAAFFLTPLFCPLTPLYKS